MKTLVTGATGFLGSHLVRELVRAGKPGDVRTLTQTVPEWLRALGVDALEGSITSPGDVAKVVKGVARIYHLAGFVSRKPADKHRMFSIHVDGTRILCAAAVEARVKRMVLASSSGTVAVARRADEMPDESSPTPIDIIARWPYYASKHYQEEAARRGCTNRLDLVIVNPSLLLGPGDDRLSSTGDVMSFLGRDIPMVPPGGLNFVDVRDVAAALPAAMERGGHAERYLLGGVNWTFREFFGRLERLTKVAGPPLDARKLRLGKLPLLATRAQAALYRNRGRTPPLEPQSVEMAEYFWFFDSGKARRDLGFVARDPTGTLHDTVAYIRRHFLGNQALTA